MEFAAAAISSIASAGASAGAASAIPGAIGATSLGGAPLAGGMLSSFASAGSAASILSGGATVLSVMNAGRAADAKAAALNSSADDAITQSTIAQTQGIERRASLKAGLVQTLGKRDVATAASGVDASFGTPAVARQQDVADSDRALSIDQDTTAEQTARLRERAGNLRLQAVQTHAGGLATQASLALEGAAKILKRG